MIAEDKTYKSSYLGCTCVYCKGVHLAAYTNNRSVSWCVKAEVMLDSMNVRTMYQHEEIWLRGKDHLCQHSSQSHMANQPTSIIKSWA